MIYDYILNKNSKFSIRFSVSIQLDRHLQCKEDITDDCIALSSSLISGSFIKGSMISGEAFLTLDISCKGRKKNIVIIKKETWTRQRENMLALRWLTMDRIC